MDDALRILHANPQDLTVLERAQVLAQCEALAFQLEASQMLDSVRDARRPEFEFSKRALHRFKTLLDWTGTSERIRDLQDSNPGVFMIFGLCFTTRDIIRMKDEMFREILRQVRITELRLTPHLVYHTEIVKVVNTSSNNIFKEKFEALRAERSIASHISTILMNGVFYYHYIAPTQPKLEPLTHLSFNGTVAVYLPEIAIDGVLRITTPWDIEFLEKLFVFNKEAEFDAVGFTTCSYTARVAHCLGQDIFNAMEASLTRGMEIQENQDSLTNCVKCQGFPGQVIIVDVTISKAECRSILEY